MKRWLLLSALLLTLYQEKGEAIEALKEEFYIFLDLFPTPPDNPWASSGAISSKEAVIAERVAVLKEEAAYVFSGMIYGFNFLYVPLDRERGVSEKFVLEPLGSIERGDPAIEIYQIYREESYLIVNIQYKLAPLQKRRVENQRSNVLYKSGGRGRAEPIPDDSTRKLAIEDGIKEAIRHYLRGIVYEKPRRITGKIYLKKAPLISVASGYYTSQVEILFSLEQLTPYPLY